MERRSFIKGACRICLLGAATAAVGEIASSCSPTTGKNIFRPEVTNNTVEVPLSLFDTEAFQLISPNKFAYDIAVQKGKDSNYKALLLSCTHYDNQLTVTGNGFTCSAHGSRFDKEGNVINGPAQRPLKQLSTAIVNNILLIQLI